MASAARKFLLFLFAKIRVHSRLIYSLSIFFPQFQNASRGPEPEAPEGFRIGAFGRRFAVDRLDHDLLERVEPAGEKVLEQAEIIGKLRIVWTGKEVQAFPLPFHDHDELDASVHKIG